MPLPPARFPALPLVFCGLAALSAGATDFKAQIMPILKRKCVDCHSAAKKVKGKFDIDVPASYAENVKAGSPEVSKLFTSITAPDDDEDVMPPKGKNRMTPGEVAAVKAWIAEGASFTPGGARPATVPAAGGGAQSWTNTAGKILQAEFDRMEGQAVVLKTAEGRYYSVPLASLSPESQAQAKRAAGQ